MCQIKRCRTPDGVGTEVMYAIKSGRRQGEVVEICEKCWNRKDKENEPWSPDDFKNN